MAQTEQKNQNVKKQFEELQSLLERAMALQTSMVLFEWDDETLAPKGAAEHTARVIGSLSEQYQEILDDQIMNNVEEEAGQNKVVTANIDIYERYVQIQTKSSIDAKTIKVLNPKEVVFEGGRELELDAVSEVPRYYVCNAYGVCGIYSAPGTAVKEAYDTSGIVTNVRGVTVWLKGNRVSRNQIMAIKEESVTEQKNSLAVCLDNILRHAGITRNTEYDLAQGKTATTILSENMTGVQVLDLCGCV